MTREEAKYSSEYGKTYFIRHQNKKSLKEFERLVDDIFAYFEQKISDGDIGESWQEGYNQAKRDFEQRTCATCLYFTECEDGYNYCDSYSRLNGFIQKDFGCNSWEAKETK